MKKSIINLLQRLEFFEKATTNSQILKNRFNFSFDSDYLEFIDYYQNVEGEISKNEYLSFWEINEIIELNPYYPDIPECKNLIFFASNGSNLGYAFEKISSYVISYDYLEIGIEPYNILAKTFEEFLILLSEKN